MKYRLTHKKQGHVLRLCGIDTRYRLKKDMRGIIEEMYMGGRDVKIERNLPNGVVMRVTGGADVFQIVKYTDDREKQ